MKSLRTVRTALRALRRNMTRALLTMLGIVIGIAAVIAMMEIGNGATQTMLKSIASMGANNMVIFPGGNMFGGVNSGSGSRITLTPQDCSAILRECPSVRQGSVLIRAGGQVIYGNKNWSPGNIYGVEPSYLDVRNWTAMEEGEAFTAREVTNSSAFCMIGQTVKKQLFGDESPIGKQIRINSVPFRVMGLLTAKGANVMGQDQDDIVLAPWTTIRARVSNKKSAGGSGSSSTTSSSSSGTSVNSISDLYPEEDLDLYPATNSIQEADTPNPVRFSAVDQIVLDVRSTEIMQKAMDEVTALLRERHGLRGNDEDDFNIRNMAELTKTLSSTSNLMTRLLLFVALVSLVVGGVGIMNIMLVSVTERTREIGLRMSVGARSWDILVQFLVEAIILCLSGGVIGICLGRGVSVIIANTLHWPTQVSMAAIILSVAVSGTVGVVFGFYPAFRASRLDPIEALRYE